jgi:dihydroxyacetone kinase-like predicted kinase
MTAQQAARVAEADGSDLRLLVAATRTVPQGIAAQLAFNSDASPDENVAAMVEAAAAVRTVEVTRATRNVELDGVAVREGDVLGLLDDVLVAAGSDLIDVSRTALSQAGADAAEIVTLYRGADVPVEDADRFADALRQAFPTATIEIQDGGQPHYDYLISVE